MRIRLAFVSLFVVALGCRVPHNNNLPPATQLAHPGPGVGGPGPGVMMLGTPAPSVVNETSQVVFAGPEGMKVTWDVSAPNAFDSEPLFCPARFNFGQGAIYRLKLTDIPGRVGVELYPTLEVAPVLPRTAAYLAHNAIPFQLTDEDFDYVLTGNFVTKVIYLPDTEFQEMALAGVETLVSTRLDPGVDPIVEADRRGAIMAIIRLGNKDLEVPGAEGAYGGEGMMGGGPGCGPQGGAMPAGYISGMGGEEYGMPITGTPIGLPGPPHIPLGAPAGLKKHVIRNFTHVHMPRPDKRMVINVKQTPGLSYPKPANHAHIVEHARRGHAIVPPISNRFQLIQSAPEACVIPGEACATDPVFISDH